MEPPEKRLRQSTDHIPASELDKAALQQLLDQKSQRLTTETLENNRKLEIKRLYCDGNPTKLGFCQHNGCNKPRNLFRVVKSVEKSTASADDITKHFNAHHEAKKDRVELRRLCAKYVTTRHKPLNSFETPEMKDVLTWYDKKNGPKGVSAEEISDIIK